MAESNKDIMYSFLQDPSREKFVEIVFNGNGEQNNLEFKEQWIDYQKISEIILGIANSGGGAIVFGVKELNNGTLNNEGLIKLEDKAIADSKLRKFLPETIDFEILDFNFSGEEYSKLKNKLFQVLIVNSKDDLLPYIWNKDSNGSEMGTIFIRRGTKTCKANSKELDDLIKKRIKSTYSEKTSLELGEHIGQLKILYESISKNKKYYSFPSNVSNTLQNLMKPVGMQAKTEKIHFIPKKVLKNS